MNTTEKKVSHTPGEWRIVRGEYLYNAYEPSGNGIGDQIGYVAGLRVDNTNIDVWGHRTSKSVTEANAKLIAAAPDLLEALQKAERLITATFTEVNRKEIQNHLSGGFQEAVKDAVLKDVLGITAAIKKATL